MQVQGTRISSPYHWLLWRAFSISPSWETLPMRPMQRKYTLSYCNPVKYKLVQCKEIWYDTRILLFRRALLHFPIIANTINESNAVQYNQIHCIEIQWCINCILYSAIAIQGNAMRYKDTPSQKRLLHFPILGNTKYCDAMQHTLHLCNARKFDAIEGYSCSEEPSPFCNSGKHY